MNTRFFYITKIFYILSCIILSTPYSYAAPAATQWVTAPLACLPNRAVKWTLDTEMEPCHCPPQELCGTDEPDIQPEDIRFTVSLGYEEDGSKKIQLHNGIQEDAVIVSFLGTDVPDIKNGTYTITDILDAKDAQVKHGDNFLRDLLNDTVKAKAGIDMATFWIKPDAEGPNWRYQNFVSVEIINAKDIINDMMSKINMPRRLVSICCENQLCPKGMYPEVVKRNVPIDYTPKTFLKADLDKATDAMINYNNSYNNLSVAKTNISTTISAMAKKTITNKNIYLVNATPLKNLSLTSFTTLKQDFTDYLSYIDNNSTQFAPLSTNMSAINALKTIQDMHAELTAEAVARNANPATREVNSLSCKYDTLVIREGCIREGTDITLADGTKQKIENLRVGDTVKTQNGTAKITAKSHFTQNTDYMFSINKGRAFFTIEHPILTTEGWKSIEPKVTSTKVTHMNIKGALKVGDILIREDGKNITVTSIDKFELSNTPQAFNLSLSDKSNFYADGYLMKSFGQMQMHY